MTHASGYFAAADPARLRSLSRYSIMESPREREFDDLVALTRVVTGYAIAGIGFVDERRVWYKSMLGAESSSVNLSRAFAQHTLTADMMVVPDATADPRFAECRWVSDSPHVRRYVSAPLVTSDGFVLGSLFAMDTRPGPIPAAVCQNLCLLARQVLLLLESRRTEQSYRAAVQGAGHVVIHLDGEDRLISVTPNWPQMSGFAVVRSMGRQLTDYILRGDRAAVTATLTHVRQAREPAWVECRLLTIQNDERQVELFLHPLRRLNERRVGIVGTLTDITWRKTREIEDHHAKKLESLGRLAAGVAHEINTPIQFVGDNTRFLAQSCQQLLEVISVLRQGAGDDPASGDRAGIMSVESEAELEYLIDEIPRAVRQSLDGVGRVASIVRAMKTFSHPSEQAAAADLNEALVATTTIARSQLKEVADVEFALGEIPPVLCRIGDLNQAFLNLVVNAAQAIEEKGARGSIFLSTRQDGDWVVITIADTGSGVPESIREKIFDPFFTTKPVGRGTGQGLALARAVVCQHHSGSLTMDSTMGLGTTFTIRLPINGTPQKDAGE